MSNVVLTEGSALSLGARFDGKGVNFAVFSEHARKIELCLYDEDGKTETQRLALPDRRGPIWCGYAEGLKPGQKYAYRAHGPYSPEQGHRFNPNKLLMDPYAREYSGHWHHTDALFAYDPKSPEGDLSYSTVDSAPFVPRCVVTDPAWDWEGDTPMQRPWRSTVIYEAHPKGLTQLFEQVPEELRGTYEGLSSAPVIAYLVDLGITAIELLPVHAFVDESFLLEKDLKNYWGYNSIGFFVLEPRYAGPNGLAGFRRMVQAMHKAGIEVILDVVYNHSAEGNHLGPSLSFRGLDNTSYYALSHGQPRYYANDTGCGNTINMSHPFVLRMVLDSLRYWVEECHVDGFRFDLATSLGREPQGFTQSSGFFDALRQDPVLNQVKLIAEPWDVGPGGYRVGQFPPEFSEWNDGYRDTLRRFWRGEAHSGQELAGRLLGSAAVFDKSGRRPWASINMITAHDGFCLADLTRYNDKHNEANGEDNQDGHNSNFSDNCGEEGPSDNPEIVARRARRQRNFLATLFLSQGTPMLLAGDEIGNTQLGNNNVYCQDNETAWVKWADTDETLLEFTRRLIRFRKDHPVLRQPDFLHGQARASDLEPDVRWLSFKGTSVNWKDPLLDSYCLLLRGSAESPPYRHTNDVVMIVINGSNRGETVVLPTLREGQIWVRDIDTAAPKCRPTQVLAAAKASVSPRSVVAFYVADRTAK